MNTDQLIRINGPYNVSITHNKEQKIEIKLDDPESEFKNRKSIEVLKIGYGDRDRNSISLVGLNSTRIRDLGLRDFRERKVGDVNSLRWFWWGGVGWCCVAMNLPGGGVAL